MARINLTEIPGWHELDGTERYWAGYIARQLEAKAEVKEWRPGCAHQIHYGPSIVDSPEHQMWVYLADSLLCALTHRRPKTAFRALLQAAGYEVRCTGHHFGDAYRTAQMRVELLLADSLRYREADDAPAVAKVEPSELAAREAS